MDKTKILLKPEKIKDVKFYLPEEKTCLKLADFFSTFSDTTRIKILSALAVSEMCVNDLSRILNINQTTISHQLKYLKNQNIVCFKRNGKIKTYSLHNKFINELMDYAIESLSGLKFYNFL